MKLKVVTSGVDSEYVLGDLCLYLEDKGHEVTELDFGKYRGDPEPILSQFSDGEAIYITSAHINYTRRVAQTLGPRFPTMYPNYLAPIEIIPRLRPKASIYVPHDLLFPYGEENLNEFRFLDLFQHVLAPYRARCLAATVGKKTRVHEAGWIKSSQTVAVSKSESGDKGTVKVTVFLSLIEHLRATLGIEGIVNYLRPLLTPGVRVKLPVWGGVEEIEEALRRQTQADVISAKADSIRLILDSDVIMCNGASSIHAEASLSGIPAICLLDNVGLTVSEQLEKLSHLPNLYFHDYSAKEPVRAELLQKLKQRRRPALLKNFDYEYVEAMLLEEAMRG